MERIREIEGFILKYYKIFLFLLVGFLLLKAILFVNKKISLRKWTKSNFMNISYIRKLDGFGFEAYFEKQIKNLGIKAEKTNASYDFGVDIIVGEYAIQLKNYTNTVGIAAIQEIYAGAHYYDKIPVALVSNYYTKSAIELAEKLKIELIDLEDIKNWGNIYYERSYLHKTGFYELVRSKLTASLRKKKVS